MTENSNTSTVIFTPWMRVQMSGWQKINKRTKLTWMCNKGHTWEAIPGSIKRGRWCPHCAGNITSNIEEMRNIAEDRGGKCLSKNYMNSITKLTWQCKEGHIWNAVPSFKIKSILSSIKYDSSVVLLSSITWLTTKTSFYI